MKIFTSSLFLIFNLYSFSQSSFESTGISSDWNTSSSWNETGAGDADGIPDKDDDVTILTGHTINCGNSGFNECLDLTVNFGGVINLNSSSSNMLRVWKTSGSVFNNGTINGIGFFRTIYNITLEGSGSFNNVDVQKYNTELIIGGDFTFRNINLFSGADLIITSGNTLTIEGLVSSNSYAGVVRNRGTIILKHPSFLTGTYGPSTNFNSQLGNMIYSSTGTLPAPSDYYQNVTITGTATVDNDFSIVGNLVNNGTLNFSGTPTITFDGSSSQSISGSGTNNFYNLTLNNSSGLSMSGGNINISNVLSSSSGTITQNGADVTLKSTASNTAGLIKVNSSSGYSYSSGTFTAERFFNATNPGWRMVSAPIQNSTLNDWDDEFDYCGFTGSDYSYAGCGNFCSVWFYDETAASVGNSGAGFDSATNITNSTSPDNGSIIYTAQGATTLSVSGTPEFRDRSFSVTKSGVDAAFGYNLVSNPYPCTLDWATFRGDNTFLDNSFYIYQADAGNYLTVSGTGTIPHSQGFFVKKTSVGSSTLNFSTSQTVTNQATFTRSINGINLPLSIKLVSNVNSYYDYAHVNTGSNFSNNYDPGEDIFELFSPYPDYAPNIYFLDNQLNKLDRTSVNNNSSVELLLNAKIGQFSQGQYTIFFENLSQFMIGSCLQLEDLNNGILTDLRQDSSYTFVSDTNAPNPRFKLHIDVEYDITVSNAICYDDSSAYIKLSGSNLDGYYFKLLDTSFVLVDSVMANSDSVLFSNLNAGIYTYESNHPSTCMATNQHIYIIEPPQVEAYFSTISDTFYLDTNGQVEVFFRNFSVGSGFFNWNFDDGVLSSLFSVSHTFNTPGIYNVSLTAYADSISQCYDEFVKSIIIINPFITSSNYFLDNSIKFFLKDKLLNVVNDNKIDMDLNINLMDINGRIILFDKINSHFHQVNLQSISSGVYILGIFNLDGELLLKEKLMLN